MKRAAHALKGSSQVIGGRATAASALHLENLGRGGDVAAVETALRGLRGNLAELKSALLAAMPERET